MLITSPWCFWWVAEDSRWFSLWSRFVHEVRFLQVEKQLYHSREREKERDKKRGFLGEAVNE